MPVFEATVVSPFLISKPMPDSTLIVMFGVVSFVGVEIGVTSMAVGAVLSIV